MHIHTLPFAIAQDDQLVARMRRPPLTAHLARYRMHLSLGQGGYRAIAHEVTVHTTVSGDALVPGRTCAAILARLPERCDDVPPLDWDDVDLAENVGHFTAQLVAAGVPSAVLVRYGETREAAACFFYELRCNEGTTREAALIGYAMQGPLLIGRWTVADDTQLAPLADIVRAWEGRCFPEHIGDFRVRQVLAAAGVAFEAKKN